jgi:regulator of cell morphogenesis and NO signaling
MDLALILGVQSMMVMTEADVAATTAYGEEAAQDVSVECRSRKGQQPEALISFILDRYHATHRRELADLRPLALKVEAAHAAHPECPSGLADFLGEMLEELEAHMQKEERMLFPALLAGGSGGCAPFAMRRMRLEHVDHDVKLEQLKLRTNAFAPPAGACASWVRLYAGCAKLHDDLRAHIATENDVLFPMFE